MHQIYTSEGFIIDSRPYGESGKVLFIFTKDFGLVIATAQGIRLEKSKLRPFIQDYSFGTFSLVRGKEYWRLTSANEKPSVPRWLGTPPFSKEDKGTELIAKIALLLKRLLHGEEANKKLFEIVSACNNFISGGLTSGKDFNGEEWKSLESLIVFRILNALGYVGKDVSLKDELLSNELSKGLIGKVLGDRIAINRHINKALKESHL